MSEETILQKAARAAMRQRLENTLLLQIRAAGLPEPEREVRFTPDRRWRFDFCWPDQRIAAECEGGIYSQGRHTRGKGFADDCEKYNEAVLLGYRVFRFTEAMITSGRALWLLETALWQESCIAKEDRRNPSP